MARSHSWAVRCQHEAQLHKSNLFVTLTYDDNELPQLGSLRYRDVQKFLKRLRKRQRVRFFCAGEYGSVTGRPHYHLLLFNCVFADAKPWRQDSFRSASLEALWPHGASEFGFTTPGRCSYVAQYSLKKVLGRVESERHYEVFDVRTGEVLGRRKAEFATMSRRPGLGESWFRKYRDDVLPRDYVVVAGQRWPVPRYYLEKFREEDPLRYEEVKHARLDRLASIQPSERTERRRMDSAEVFKAKLNQGRKRDF